MHSDSAEIFCHLEDFGEKMSHCEPCMLHYHMFFLTIPIIVSTYQVAH